MSLSTEDRSTSCNLRTSVIGRSDLRRNPELIRGSGRPVIKNFDIGDLVHIAGEHRKDGRGWFLVLTLVQGINDDEGRSWQ
jgi:hypothetical protein